MIDGKRVVAITLARGGSKGIPHKNIVKLSGKPLLQYTSDEVFKSIYIDEYYVSTDCDETSDFCLGAGINVIKRPSYLASDVSKSSESILHAIKNVSCDYVVEVMCTSPLKLVDDIDGCISKLNTTNSESVASVVRLLDHHPSRVKYIQNDILKDFFYEEIESRRQDLFPWAYVRNGSIYAMTRDFIIKNKCRYNKHTRPYIMPKERSINIDEPVDLLVAKNLLRMR